MTAICSTAIHVCALRVTRLTRTGAVAAGPKNAYITKKLMSVEFAPQYEEGDDKVLIDGCDCISARWHGRDKFKGFELTVARTALEPGLEEMLIGGTVILDGSDPIGVHWPSGFDCANPQLPVGVEAWADNVVGDAVDATFPYVRFVWPMVYFRLDTGTLENDFHQPSVVGYTMGNPLWAGGPYDDQPEDSEPNGDYFFDTTIPTAACGYQTVASL